MKQQTTDIRVLIDEILRPRPDLAKVRQMARALGFQAEGDLNEMMVEILRSASATSRARKRSPEVQS